MQRVQMTWDRMKKGDDVNIALKNTQFGEFIEQPCDCQLPPS